MITQIKNQYDNGYLLFEGYLIKENSQWVLLVNENIALIELELEHFLDVLKGTYEIDYVSNKELKENKLDISKCKQYKFKISEDNPLANIKKYISDDPFKIESNDLQIKEVKELPNIPLTKYIIKAINEKK